MAEAVQFDPDSHTYFRNGVPVPHVTEILAKAGRCDYSHVHEESRLHSIRRGQSVHWMCQLEDEGALNVRRMPHWLRGYRNCYRDWKKRSGFTVWWIERRFISRLGFAGTLDRFGYFPTAEFRGRTYAVVDLKTGDLQEWVRYQLSPYTLAVDPRPAIARNVRRIALRLNADGSDARVREFPRSTWDRDFAVFMQDLKTYGEIRQDSDWGRHGIAGADRSASRG